MFLHISWKRDQMVNMFNHLSDSTKSGSIHHHQKNPALAWQRHQLQPSFSGDVFCKAETSGKPSSSTLPSTLHPLRPKPQNVQNAAWIWNSQVVSIPSSPGAKLKISDLARPFLALSITLQATVPVCLSSVARYADQKLAERVLDQGKLAILGRICCNSPLVILVGL